MGPGTRTTSFELVERVRSGDEDAFRALFERYYQRLAVLVHYRLSAELRPLVEPDDILQETFLAASRGIDRFEYRAPGAFYRWLIAIAQHTLEDAGRQAGRRKRDGGVRVPLRSASQPGGVEPRDTLTPTRILFQQERVREMMARLDRLPPQYRDVIVMAKLEQMTTAEIAARLDKPRETVAVLLCRALQRFREEST